MDKVFCPNCKLANPSTATRCGFCGAELHAARQRSDEGRDVIQTNLLSSEMAPGIPDPAGQLAPLTIEIYTSGNGAPIFVGDKDGIILGRTIGEDEEDEALLDLAKYGAYECGVSRRHAVLRRTSTGYAITDLGSSNGTWLESMRLAPKMAYPVNSRSKLFLGKMEITLIYK